MKVLIYTLYEEHRLKLYISVHCKQTNKVKRELDEQPSSLLVCMRVSNYKANFSPMYLVFLELDTHQPRF